jgi:hypothetical protein
MLVSYKGAQPQKLPKKYEGKTEQELNQLGFVICPEPPIVLPGYKLWWQNNQWSTIPPNDAEIEIQWQTVKDKAVSMLQASDYRVLKAYEAQVPVEPFWINYRQNLRDIYNNKEGLNPFDINWPIAAPPISNPEVSE